MLNYPKEIFRETSGVTQNSQEKKLSLAGLKVVSFETRRAFEMESLIVRQGGQALIAPSMLEIPFEQNREAIDFGRKILDGSADIVIFMTGVGTRFLFEIVGKHLPKEQFLQALSSKTLVARGPKPIAVLKEAGLTPGIVVPPPNTWREVLSSLSGLSLEGKKIFVQEYGIENQEFISELKKKGARVARVPVYRWALPEDVSALKQAILEVVDGKADILMFTNATQVYHLLRVAAEEGLETSLREAMARVVVASVGPVVSENLRETGLPVDFQARESKMGLFVQEAAQKCPALLQEKRSRWQETIGRVEVRHYEAKPYSQNLCKDSPFLKACRQESAEYTPIWLMRQAGRYMKEYREVRAKVSFIDLCKNPDLACEVTVTAQERLGVDAAIIFSDILLIMEPMGVGLEYSKGEGPNIYRPIRTPEQIERVAVVEPQDSMSFVFEAIRKTRSALKPQIPLIGFAGAPFTVVSYMVEGKGSSNYYHTKQLMYNQTSSWNQLMEKVTESTVRYIQGQIEAGSQAVQIFDSWIGCLSPSDYRQYVFPHMQRLFSSMPKDVPAIHFGTGTAGLLELMKEAGGTVIGVDWRVNLGPAWDRLGKVAVQGNLDPMVLLSDVKTIRAKTEEILKQARNRPGHIFNLGHGILPQTPVDHAIALVDIVHELTRK